MEGLTVPAPDLSKAVQRYCNLYLRAVPTPDLEDSLTGALRAQSDGDPATLDDLLCRLELDPEWSGRVADCLNRGAFNGDGTSLFVPKRNLRLGVWPQPG